MNRTAHRGGRGRAGALGIALLVAVLQVAPTVQAQDDDELLRQALVEFNAGRWDEAYALFKRLHEQEPTARTLRGMGLSAFEARRYALTVHALRAALAETRRPLDDKQRSEVEKVLSQAEGFVARFSLRVAPGEAVVEVDGREPTLDPGGVLLIDPGRHEVVARAPGYEPARRTLNVQAGDRDDLVLELKPEGGAPPPVSTTRSDTRPLQAEVSEGGGRSLVGFFIAAGAAVGFAGGAAALHFMASGGADRVEDACQGACTPAQADQRIDDENIELYQTLSFVGWGLSGAAATTAVILLLTSSGGEQESPPPVSLGPTGVTFRGRF